MIVTMCLINFLSYNLMPMPEDSQTFIVFMNYFYVLSPLLLSVVYLLRVSSNDVTPDPFILIPINLILSSAITMLLMIITGLTLRSMGIENIIDVESAIFLFLLPIFSYFSFIAFRLFKKSKNEIERKEKIMKVSQKDIKNKLIKIDDLEQLVILSLRAKENGLDKA